MFFELEKKLDFTNKNNVEGPFQWKRVSNCLEVAVMCEKEKPTFSNGTLPFVFYY